MNPLEIVKLQVLIAKQGELLEAYQEQQTSKPNTKAWAATTMEGSLQKWPCWISLTKPWMAAEDSSTKFKKKLFCASTQGLLWGIHQMCCDHVPSQRKKSGLGLLHFGQQCVGMQVSQLFFLAYAGCIQLP